MSIDEDIKKIENMTQDLMTIGLRIEEILAANKRLRELVVEAYFAGPEQIRERTIECVQEAIAALKENP